MLCACKRPFENDWERTAAGRRVSATRQHPKRMEDGGSKVEKAGSGTRWNASLPVRTRDKDDRRAHLKNIVIVEYGLKEESVQPHEHVVPVLQSCVPGTTRK